MAEVQRLFGFPPAPKLDVLGKLGADASEELAGEALSFGEAQCSTCHAAPCFTDDALHDLGLERFFGQKVVVADGDGPIKTFPLRGIKESPPYLHDGRLLTLEDTVESFNLALERRLSADEKSALLAYLLVL